MGDHGVTETTERPILVRLQAVIRIKVSFLDHVRNYKFLLQSMDIRPAITDQGREISNEEPKLQLADIQRCYAHGTAHA